MTRRDDGNGTPTPEELEREDTGPLSAQMLAASSDAGIAAPMTQDPEQFLEAVAVRLAEKVGNGKPPPTFLGVAAGKWVMYIAGLALTAALGVGGWIIAHAVEHKENITHDQLNGEFNKHLDKPHPGAANKADVQEIKTRVRRIETQQTEIRKDVEHVREGVDDIKQELRERRRRRR